MSKVMFAGNETVVEIVENGVFYTTPNEKQFVRFKHLAAVDNSSSRYVKLNLEDKSTLIYIDKSDHCDSTDIYRAICSAYSNFWSK